MIIVSMLVTTYVSYIASVETTFSGSKELPIQRSLDLRTLVPFIGKQMDIKLW